MLCPTASRMNFFCKVLEEELQSPYKCISLTSCCLIINVVTIAAGKTRRFVFSLLAAQFLMELPPCNCTLIEKQEYKAVVKLLSLVENDTMLLTLCLQSFILLYNLRI